MQRIHIISVGKNSSKEINSLEQDYLKRFNAPKVNLYEVKAHSENLDLESKEVLKKIEDIEKKGKSKVFLMAEKGREYDSPEFSKWIFKSLELTNDLCLVIGGAAGHGKSIIERSDGMMSLSKLTFPHKLARLILIEQVYRAKTIFDGHPYHK